MPQGRGVRVGFLHVGDDIRLPTIMVKSVQAHGYELVQMTDDDSPGIPGCEVWRLEWDGTRLMTYRLEHLALSDEPLIVLDTDVVMLDHLDDVWGREFDAALTRRKNVIYDPQRKNIVETMPYNTGVMLCRNTDFWKRAHEICASLHEDQQKWWGDQLSVAEAAKEFHVLELPCAEFNRTPRNMYDAPDGARIIHYKGDRKQWMIDAFSHLV